MKQIILFLLVIILAIIGYNQYKQYQRFSLKNYEYRVSNNIDLDYHDKIVLYKYYEAVEGVNNYIGSQWSTNDIDVRSPEDDDEETRLTVDTYTKKLAKVKYLEAQLEKSKTLKDKGLSNNDIKLFEDEGISLKDKQKAEADAKIKTMLNHHSKLVFGERNAFVYEIQKLLVAKGINIPLDGVYKSATTNAILEFETRNGLFPDGNIDLLTLEDLLN